MGCKPACLRSQTGRVWHVFAVMVQDLYCVQVRASGCKFWQDLSWEQGTAKTMTSPLIIPSVLAIGLFFFYLIYKVFELLNLESNRESFHIYMAIRSVQITARHLSVPKISTLLIFYNFNRLFQEFISSFPNPLNSRFYLNIRNYANTLSSSPIRIINTNT